MTIIFDVILGVVFVFLLFSLVVSAANELWLSWLDKRAAFLKEGLEELLRDSQGAAGAITPQDLLQHGLITTLSRGLYDPTAGNTRGVPSYIPSKQFALALLSLVKQKAAAAGAVTTLRAGIDTIANHELKQVLLALHDDARGRSTGVDRTEPAPEGLDAWDAVRALEA